MIYLIKMIRFILIFVLGTPPKMGLMFPYQIEIQKYLIHMETFLYVNLVVNWFFLIQ